MSQQYDEYLHDHISNVNKGLQWMIDHNIIPDKDYWNRKGFSLQDQVQLHDRTKYFEDEYDAYDDYFYGKEGKDEDDIAVIDAAFDYAWLHHIHHNLHHWQYWVLIEDEGNMKALEMPETYVYEMIADWWSFSWKKNKLTEIFDWYEDHKNKMVLNPATKLLVEEILARMKDILITDAASKEEAEDGTNA